MRVCTIVLVVVFGVRPAGLLAETVVNTWKVGGAAVSLTHDDNRIDHIDIAAPALLARGLRGTFNVNPGKWATVPSHEHFAADYAGLAADGHELSSHTMYHTPILVNPEDPSFFASLAEVEQDANDVVAVLDPLQFSGRETASIAYPFGQSSTETRDLLSGHFISGRLSGGPAVNSPSPPDMFLLGARIVGAGSASPTPWSDYDYAYDALTAMVASATIAGGWVIEEYHDIDVPGYGGLNVNAYYDHLDDLGDAVASGEVWVAPQGDVARYIIQRNALRATEQSFLGSIVVNAEDGLDDDRFDMALTMQTDVPAHWELSIVLSQAGEPIPFEVISGGTAIRYSIVPNGVDITISTAPGDANLDGYVDGADYLVWASNYGDDPADDPPGPPRNGDFDYDGVVGGSDYLLWSRNVGKGPQHVLEIPEASSSALCVIGSVLIVLFLGRETSLPVGQE